MNLKVAYPMDNEYLRTEPEIYVETDAGTVRVRRTGISEPGPWPARAVYECGGQHYVYEDGWLIPSREWHAAQASKHDAVRVIVRGGDFDGVPGYVLRSQMEV